MFDDFIAFVRSVSLDVDQKALILIVIQERLSLGVIDIETITDASFGVVLSLSERFSGNIIESRFLRRAIASVVHSSTGNMGPTVYERVIEGRAKRSRELILILSVRKDI